MERKVTNRHAAEDAGVSLQTVSRVMNSGLNVRFSQPPRTPFALARRASTAHPPS